MLTLFGRFAAGRAYAVSPVIVIRKTPAGPAEHRNAQRFQPLERLLPIAVDVGDGRVLAYPNAPVNATAEVLGKRTVQQWADRADLGRCVDGHSLLLRRGGEAFPGSQGGEEGRAGASRKGPAGKPCGHEGLLN
jgi:hypothetical protein